MKGSAHLAETVFNRKVAIKELMNETTLQNTCDSEEVCKKKRLDNSSAEAQILLDEMVQRYLTRKGEQKKT